MHWYWQPNKNNQETEQTNIQITQNNTAQKVALVNSTKKDNSEKPRLRDRRETAWFSQLLRHPARRPGNGAGLFLQPRSLHRACCAGHRSHWLLAESIRTYDVYHHKPSLSEARSRLRSDSLVWWAVTSCWWRRSCSCTDTMV